ncbi:MAG: peptidase C11 [Clostridiales bacterium]|nr:peptidase C11 [Clostridiales bacterium]
MNNTPGSGGRKTNVTGSANVGKGEQVGTTGPVGRQDGYSGRNGGGSGSRPQGAPSARGIILGNSKGGSLGRIVALLVVVALIFIISRNCKGGLNTGDLINQFIPSQGYDNYDPADAYAPTASSASTSATSADLSVAGEARAKRTVLKGDGSDTVTIMVYMCGTDLESKYGMATNDLNEMLHAELNDDRVNVIVETGGTKQWKNTVISSSINQRWRVTNKGLKKLEELNKRNMTDPATLSDFINYCKKEFPANRYMLIFWDHGGGSLSGYGYDQNFSGSMTLDKINKALKDGGTVFDFIGFDACLMATMETALVTEQYADYLIGSEETEPGCGWYYTNWLTELSKNTSISTVKLGKRIVDDFNDVCKKNNAGDATTLSIIDLAEFAGTVPKAFAAFSTNVSELLDGDEYSTVANARSGAREFGKSAGINHVDLVHLAMRINTEEANRLVKALNGCIKYNRTSSSMANSYGLSIYFPLTSFKNVGSAVKLYDSIGMDENYTAAVRSFASLAAGGQLATGTSSSPVGSLLGNFTGTSSGTSSSSVLSTLLSGYLSGGSDTSGGLLSSLMGSDYSSWFDGNRVMANTEYYDGHALYSDDMQLTEKNGGWVLSLSAEKWAIVDSVQLNLFVDDGQGYIDLGMDNVYRFDEDGDLVIESDRSWLALNGQIVPYYMISEVHDGDSYTITGRVPALLNGELVYVIIVFDNETPENEYGYVAGARYIYDDYETDTLGRGLIAINNGDRLEFVCDYYRYDGTYEGSYKLGDALVVNGKITVSNVTINDLPVIATWCLADIYGNEFWTESKKF